MNTMLNELIKIKTFRKNKAETDLALQKKNVSVATEALHSAETELARYMLETAHQEKVLFQKIQHQPVKLQTIEEMNQEISLLREGIVEREEIKRDAGTELQVSQKRLKEAKEHYQQTLRVEEKFLSLARIYDQAALREAERLSDLELEEVPITPRRIEEWEHPDE